MQHLRKLTLAAVTLLALLTPLAAATRAEAAGSIIWKMSETSDKTLQGKWAWNVAKKHFVGRWSNGAVAVLKVEKIDKSQVVLSRQDPQGATKGLQARYVGRRSGHNFQGTVEWTWRGKTWNGTWKAQQSTSTAAGRTPLNRIRFANERVVLDTRERANFPNLRASYEVLAPATGPAKRTGSYNCIAWTVGITNRWEWPGARVSQFDTFYGRFGYHRISALDFQRRAGVEKIVLYGKKKSDGSVEATHGARQLKDGTWTSKLGGLALIRHLTPGAVNGPSYGQPIAVYVRLSK